MAKAAAKSKAAGRTTARTKAPAKRRASRAAAPAKPKRAARRASQKFTVSHARDADFKADGLRPYARYRDLGIAAATGGLCQAHVIQMIPPVTDEVRKRHYHDTELQLIYVLKGWMKNEFEGHGEQLMEAGSCWLQPPKIKHTVLDYSDDLEVLEIIVPADFKTVDLTK
jgi:mannose-6-phosphate isomerase-like protein (cupin superfamily)